MNSMAFTSPAAMKVMQDEIKLGARLSVELENTPPNQERCWGVLFEHPPFFQQYRHYLVVEVAAVTKEDLAQWYSMIESRLRVLAGAVHRTPGIVHVHTNPMAHVIAGTPEWPHCVCFFLGLVLDRSLLPCDLSKCRDDFFTSVTSWSGHNDRKMWIHIRHCKRRELPITPAAQLEDPKWRLKQKHRIAAPEPTAKRART
jgi:poly(A) polymerase Pap1